MLYESILQEHEELKRDGNFNHKWITVEGMEQEVAELEDGITLVDEPRMKDQWMIRGGEDEDSIPTSTQII